MHPLAKHALVALSALPSLAAAQGIIVPRPCIMDRQWPERPNVIIPCNPRAPQVVRTRSDVRVDLQDRVLRYDVEERFVNRGSTVGEAEYLFPLPAGAAFQDLKLSINGELVAGETMNANDARNIYEEIVRKQRDPALVEWMGHGLLRARIFPINPGEEKRVVVRFQSVAQREGDALRIDYFRGTPADARPGADRPATSFTLSFRDDPSLGTPYSPTHTIDNESTGDRRRVTVRGDARDLTLLVPMRRSGAAAIGMLPYAPGNDDGFALITVSPPATPAGASTPRDITLVLDVSGSMQGRKMEQARLAGAQLLAMLRPQDRFRLIDFSTDVRTFRDDFVYATEENLRDARRYLDRLDAEGSTNIGGALAEAVRPSPTAGRLPVVLFITDGEPTVGERRPAELARMASGTARRIFTFGLGSDVNVTLLEQLAIDGRGTAQFVRPDESVERMVGVVASRLIDPVVTDVRVHVEGDVKLTKLMPSQPADVFAGSDLVLLSRYTGHGSARIIVEGRQRGAPVQWTTQVNFPDRERDNPFVARLWATQRVGFLSADKRKNGGSPELDAEIRSLGERYGIPTEFTSYLVQEAGMISQRRMNTLGAVVPPPVAGASRLADARDQAFEHAKTAAAQRAVTSVASLQEVIVTGATAGTARVVGGHTFSDQNGVWTDARYRTTMKTIKIKPFSKAYFDLLTKLPELRQVFALGEHVIVAGRQTAIELADAGVETLSASDLAVILSEAKDLL